MNLACVGPHPPVRSGVADYSAALLPYLRPHFARLTVVVDGYAPQLPPGLVDEVHDIREGADWWRGGEAVPLYHTGNHFQYHRYVYEALRRFPGVTVLHDGTLLPFIHERTLAEGQRGDFVREAGFERGAEGLAAAWTSLRRAEPLDLEAYPMLARVARASLGVIVHNRYLRDRVLKTHPDARVGVIPHLDLLPSRSDPVPRRKARLSLGLDPNGLLIGAFGFVAPTKRLDAAVRAFANVRDQFPQAIFLCVGEVVPEYDFQAVLDELVLDDAVQVTGYVPMQQFVTYLRAVDVGVNLRFPTWGESSGTLLRLMACGVPTLVTDAGGFAELPDEAVVKVPAAPDEATAIEEALGGLLDDVDKRAAIGETARTFVADECEPAKVAEQYWAFISAAVEGGNGS